MLLAIRRIANPVIPGPWVLLQVDPLTRQSVSATVHAPASAASGEVFEGQLTYHYLAGASEPLPDGPSIPHIVGTQSTTVQLTFPIRRAFYVPVITDQPKPVSVLPGATASFSVTAKGVGPFTYQWARDGTSIIGGTASTYRLASVTAADFGQYTVRVSDPTGTVLSDPAHLSLFIPLREPPRILTQPASQTLLAGGSTVLSVVVTGTPPLTYQWRRDDTPIPGTNSDRFFLTEARPSLAGRYSVTVTNAFGAVTSLDATVTIEAIAHIANLSVLTSFATPNDALTVGGVIGGNALKPLLMRAVGPSLAQFGITGALEDPRLEVFIGQTKGPENDNWGGTTSLSGTFTALGAFPLFDAGSRDAAMRTSLPPGNFSLRIFPGAGATGLVLAELYDAIVPDSFKPDTPRLINVSVLKHLGAHETLTVGFVTTGAGSKRLLLRAVGPTLSAAPFNLSNAHPDPKLEVFAGSTKITHSDNWGGEPATASAAANVGAFALLPTGKDAALLITLQPGSYTALVTGVDAANGLTLVEVYEVP